MTVNPKVQAAGWAGAVTIILIWIAGLFGLDVPPEVASAFTALVATTAGFLKAAS